MCLYMVARALCGKRKKRWLVFLMSHLLWMILTISFFWPMQANRQPIFKIESSKSVVCKLLSITWSKYITSSTKYKVDINSSYRKNIVLIALIKIIWEFTECYVCFLDASPYLFPCNFYKFRQHINVILLTVQSLK